jgi:hypothetical protein
MGWSWCVDDLEPARRDREPAAACGGGAGAAAALPAAFFFSSSGDAGVKYDWNFFMVAVLFVVVVGNDRTGSMVRVSPGTPSSTPVHRSVGSSTTGSRGREVGESLKPGDGSLWQKRKGKRGKLGSTGRGRGLGGAAQDNYPAAWEPLVYAGSEARGRDSTRRLAAGLDGYGYGPGAWVKVVAQRRLSIFRAPMFISGAGGHARFLSSRPGQRSRQAKKRARTGGF